MTIIVDLCRRLAEPVGPRLEFDVRGIHTVADLREAIAVAHPPLAIAMISGRVRACIGDAIVPNSAVVGAGMTIAFFPPLSGG